MLRKVLQPCRGIKAVASEVSVEGVGPEDPVADLGDQAEGPAAELFSFQEAGVAGRRRGREHSAGLKGLMRSGARNGYNGSASTAFTIVFMTRSLIRH